MAVSRPRITHSLKVEIQDFGQQDGMENETKYSYDITISFLSSVQHMGTVAELELLSTSSVRIMQQSNTRLVKKGTATICHLVTSSSQSVTKDCRLVQARLRHSQR